MPFEINLENANGKFHVKLTREVSCQEALQFVQLATNIIPDPKKGSDTVFGPVLPPNFEDSNSGSNKFMQYKLGEHPAKEISMGDYTEPKDGIRLKVLSIPFTGRMQCVKALRELTHISIIGCKDILFGNYPCPILTQEVGDKMMAVLKEHGFHAKIVPANELNNNAAA